MLVSNCPSTIAPPLRDVHNGITIVFVVSLEMVRVATSGVQSAMTTKSVAPVWGCSAQLQEMGLMIFSHMRALIPEDRH